MVSAVRRANPEDAAVLRSPVNRNGFLLGCLEYSQECTEEHLIVGLAVCG